MFLVSWCYFCAVERRNKVLYTECIDACKLRTWRASIAIIRFGEDNTGVTGSFPMLIHVPLVHCLPSANHWLPFRSPFKSANVKNFEMDISLSNISGRIGIMYLINFNRRVVFFLSVPIEYR